MALLSLACSIDVNAQDANVVTPLRDRMELTDPAPSGFAPVSISLSEANDEVRENSAKAGFSEVYFAKADIEELLKSQKAVGIRFYNAKDKTATGALSLVAVAAQSDGKEINPLFSKSYCRSQPLSGDNLAALPITQGTAKGCEGTVCNTSTLVPFTAFFTRSDLNELVKGDAVGVKLIPASRKFSFKESDGSVAVRIYNTMMAIGVSSDGGSVKNIGSQFRKSLEPCPYFCPSDNHLLMPARF